MLQPELRSEWNRRDHRVTFVPFLRQDADDENCGHADIRELNWFHVDDDDILGGFARNPIIEIRLSWFF